MTTIPRDHDIDSGLAGLAFEDRELLLDAVEHGSAVRDPAHAALAVAMARRRLGHALHRDLPVYGGSAVAAGIAGFVVTRSSAVAAFTFVLGAALFVGGLWWGETWRPRRRAELANLALLESGERPIDTGPERKSFNDWLFVVPLAWVVTLAVGGVLHLVGAPGWIGMPIFVVALVLFRRLLARTVEQVDRWSKTR